MADETDVLDRILNQRSRGDVTELASREPSPTKEPEEDSGPAYGFLRGIADRALAVEFRLRTGDSEWHPYSHLAGWRYNRSVGILLKFTSDVTTLVLIRGSNLDAVLPGRAVNLTGGLHRYRITYIREMDKDELKQAGRGQPTIDHIEIVEFETKEASDDWLKKHAPAFVRK